MKYSQEPDTTRDQRLLDTRHFNTGDIYLFLSDEERYISIDSLPHFWRHQLHVLPLCSRRLWPGIAAREVQLSGALERSACSMTGWLITLYILAGSIRSTAVTPLWWLALFWRCVALQCHSVFVKLLVDSFLVCCRRVSWYYFSLVYTREDSLNTK